MHQVRQKWFCPNWHLKIGDLLLVIDESAPHGRWPKGVVQDVFTNHYVVVQQVNVRTSPAILHLDVRKFCLLEGASSLRDNIVKTLPKNLNQMDFAHL